MNINIRVYPSMESTQKYLINEARLNNIKSNMCIVALKQTSGIGSRDNEWISVSKGLYFSFAININDLPDDLKLESSSIFFGFIFKETIKSNGSKAWLKYPNDLYIGNKKIGGIMCSVISNYIICGIGVNIESSNFACIESGIISDYSTFLNQFFDNISNYNWNKVFLGYSKEFNLNHDFYFHYKNKLLSFKGVKLLYDGSISVNNDILYSIR